MGFHLVENVYSNVTGTSPTEQAVLAYLAHRADDKGVRKCYPSTERIMAATHLRKTAVRSALNELRAKMLISWVSGGRHKGNGGRALANEYVFNLPDKPTERCVREANHAGAAKQTMQGSPGEPCRDRQTNPIKIDQSSSQPSVNGATEADTAVLKSEIEGLAEQWSVNRKQTKVEPAEDCSDDKYAAHFAVNEAMRVCGVNDVENRKKFSSTIAVRDPKNALCDVIYPFESELMANKHQNIRSRARVLTSLLAALPRIC